MNGNYDHELIMSQREYERTGKQIRVPEDELVSIVLDRIDHYLTLHPRERRNYPDPRTDAVVTRIASGKTIQIPQQIVNKALDIHQACGRIGTVERMESIGEQNKMSESHTRLAKRERYSQDDPFVMNEDIRGLSLVGRDGEVAGDATFDDYPQRYREFNRNMSNNISRNDMASDFEDRSNPYNSYLHSRGNDQHTGAREDIRAFKYGQSSLAHRGGPNGGKGGRDYMDEVSGVDSDISPEDGSASVYASLSQDDDDNQRSNDQQQYDVMGSDVNMDVYDNEPDYNCVSCGHDDGYRSNYPYNSDMHPSESDNGHFDHRNYSDDYPSMGSDYVPTPGYNENAEDRFRVDTNGYYEDENDDAEALVESYANNSSRSSNYALWLLLIVLAVILIIHYYKNKDANVSQLGQF